MNGLVFVGYEVRERYANDPARPLTGYPLRVGNVTIDTRLCRRAVGIERRKNASLPLVAWRDALSNLHEAQGSAPDRLAVFGYRLDRATATRCALGEIAELLEGADGWVRCGVDLADSSQAPREWTSVVANEGLSLAALESHGAVNQYGLYEDIAAAARLRDACNGDKDTLAIAEVWLFEKGA